MYDYHVHSSFSSDCEYTMDDMVVGALHNKLQEICFTDHIDYDHKDPSIVFDIDHSGYKKTIEALQIKHQGKIHIKKGVEIGIQPQVIDRINDLMTRESFDFVICSIHTCNQEDLYLGSYFEERTVENAWLHYFDEMLSNVKSFDHYSVLGHLDLLKRYNTSVTKVPKRVYEELVREVFKVIISKGKGIEVNTSGYNNSLNEPLPNAEILSWYHDLGGEIITIGSDSHAPNRLGEHFDQAKDMLKEIGFKYTCSFNNMKANFHSL